jgi:hypothetical protein
MPPVVPKKNPIVIPEKMTIVWFPHGMSPEEVILRIPDECMYLLKETPTYQTRAHLYEFHDKYVMLNYTPLALLIARCIVMVEKILGCGMTSSGLILRIPDKCKYLFEGTITIETLGPLFDFHDEYVKLKSPLLALLIARCIVMVEHKIGWH